MAGTVYDYSNAYFEVAQKYRLCGTKHLVWRKKYVLVHSSCFAIICGSTNSCLFGLVQAGIAVRNLFSIRPWFFGSGWNIGSWTPFTSLGECN